MPATCSTSSVDWPPTKSDFKPTNFLAAEQRSRAKGFGKSPELRNCSLIDFVVWTFAWSCTFRTFRMLGAFLSNLSLTTMRRKIQWVCSNLDMALSAVYLKPPTIDVVRDDAIRMNHRMLKVLPKNAAQEQGRQADGGGEG